MGFDDEALAPLGRSRDEFTRADNGYGQDMTRSRSFNHPRIMQAVALLARLHLRRQVPNAALRAALTPAYAMGCKRVVRSSNSYPTLSREHVELVTERIREVREGSVITADGTERQLDILIFGTGFRAAEMPMAQLIHGCGGRLLADEWRRGGAQAYLGATVTGFPNLFLLTGPNSALAHNSVVWGSRPRFATCSTHCA
jgi:cation diffusion facilitator CzcD-associated flavoprotein CzcO